MDYFKNIKEDLKKNIQDITAELKLPDWKKNSNPKEADYCEAFANNCEYLNFDQVFFYPNYQNKSYDKFELCDLLKPDTNDLIFIKKYTGSSSMSHLFKQAQISLSYYYAKKRNEADFISEINNRYNTKRPSSTKKILSVSDSPRYIFAVADRNKKMTIDNLPIFSIIALHCTKKIFDGRFQLFWARINFIE